MNVKTVYQTDQSGFFVDVVAADESPLEPGVFLIPAGCVETPPPQIPAGMAARWVNGKWVLETIPVAPASPPEPEPEPQTQTPEQLADTARAERDRLIESVRWRIERHSDELALGTEPTEPLEPLLQYTQALRDVPQQAGFPEAVDWPQYP